MRWPWSRRKAQPRCLGLALSGGGVRGIAHIGVLQALEEGGIRPQVVAGTSAGALVGAMYCAGVPFETMVREACSLSWTKVGRVTRPRLGWFDISRLEAHLADLIEGATFAELAVPFAAVAADILSGEVVTISEGSVAAAVRASCSLPGIFTPVRRGDQLLVDGGLLNNVPVSVARAMGADYVVAVDLVAQRLRFRRPRHLAEMALLTYSNFAVLANRGREDADLLVTPDVGHMNLADFSQATELIDRGREAGTVAVAQLREELSL